jgi:hypothetical protein
LPVARAYRHGRGVGVHRRARYDDDGGVPLRHRRHQRDGATVNTVYYSKIALDGSNGA